MNKLRTFLLLVVLGVPLLLTLALIPVEPIHADPHEEMGGSDQMVLLPGTGNDLGSNVDTASKGIKRLTDLCTIDPTPNRCRNIKTFRDNIDAREQEREEREQRDRAHCIVYGCGEDEPGG